MGTLYITEYVRTGIDPRGHNLFPVEPPMAEQIVTISGTSAQSSAFNDATTFIRVKADVACSVLIGTNPTATAASKLLDAGQVEYLAIPAKSAYKIAVISNTGASISTTPSAGSPGVTHTDRSSTITFGGTAQSLMAANSSRNGWRLQNLDASETLYFNDTGSNASTTAVGSYSLLPGAYYEGNSRAAISIVAATTGHKFSASEY